MGKFYGFIKHFGGAIMHLIYRIRVVGRENIPSDGGYILCCNHTHFMDVAFLVTVFPQKIRFMAKEELFSGKGAWFVKAMGAFPVARGTGTGGISAIHTAEKILQGGGVMGIFPEGTRSRDGRPHKAKSGVAVIAAGSGAPVLPVSIYYEGNLKLFKKITVNIGPAIPPEALRMEENNRAELRRVSSMIMDNITKQWEMGHCK